MISREAMNRVKNAPYFKGNIRYEPTQDDADIFCLKGKLPEAAQNWELVNTTHKNRYMHQNLMSIVDRHNPAHDAEDLKILDSQLKGSLLSQYCVLMFEFELEEVEEKLGAMAGTALKF